MKWLCDMIHLDFFYSGYQNFLTDVFCCINMNRKLVLFGFTLFGYTNQEFHNSTFFFKRIFNTFLRYGITSMIHTFYCSKMCKEYLLLECYIHIGRYVSKQERVKHFSRESCYDWSPFDNYHLAS